MIECQVFVLVGILSIPILVQGSNIQIGGEDDRKSHVYPAHLISRYKDTAGESAEQENYEHWFNSSQIALQKKIHEERIEKVAKNVIFFLGDGMSVTTVTAARIFKGQLENSVHGGEEAELSFDKFPHIGVSKTFCQDSQVADSACSATAYLCGTKANTATIGVKPSVLHQDCEAQNNTANHALSILSWAQAAGMATGIVTTTRVTHATPAGAYAHVASRDWENDDDIKKDKKDPQVCHDIAEQLILHEPGNKINVIFGGGRRNFVCKNTPDSENQTRKGSRSDGKNLIQTWKENNKNNNAFYIENRDELFNLNIEKTDYVLGLFAHSHMAYLDKQTIDGDPSLAEMTDIAIKILSRNPRGFFLLVEGGRIDHAHHDGNAKRALFETIEFSKAVQTAEDSNKINKDETLIVVTADHSHTLTLAGYPIRGNPIFGFAGHSDVDNINYTTLSYANGKGYKGMDSNGTRFNVSQEDTEDLNYVQAATVPLDIETHGGDDVLIYSKGPYAHLMTGVQEQSYIPYVLGYAACIGPGATVCNFERNRTLLNFTRM